LSAKRSASKVSHDVVSLGEDRADGDDDDDDDGDGGDGGDDGRLGNLKQRRTSNTWVPGGFGLKSVEERREQMPLRPRHRVM
jgi:hypothetical protein